MHKQISSLWFEIRERYLVFNKSRMEEIRLDFDQNTYGNSEYLQTEKVAI